MACPACASGTLHSGTPSGEIKTLYGLQTYVASPPSNGPTKGTVVIIPDAFGWAFVNNRILADNYAQKGGFLVLLPDFMLGWDLDQQAMTLLDAIGKKPGWDPGLDTLWKVWYILHAVYLFVPFLYGARFGVTHPRVVGYMKQLREQDESKPVGTAGFCWGGKHVFLLARNDAKTASGKSLMDCGFTAHPSSLKLPEDMDKVVLPLSVACPSEDAQIYGEAIEKLKVGLEKKSKADCEVKVYEGATHGFAVRANPEIPKAHEQGHEAEDQAVAWFTRFFGS